jgi:hypothetical protein
MREHCHSAALTLQVEAIQGHKETKKMIVFLGPGSISSNVNSVYLRAIMMINYSQQGNG